MKELRVLGFPVRVSPWFLVIAYVIQPKAPGGNVLLQLVVWMLVMFAGVLLHELGHALASRAFGLSPRIELHGFGGATWSPGAGELPASRNLVISIAGPAFGIVLGALSFELLRARQPVDLNVVEYIVALFPFSETRITIPPDLAGYALHALVWVNFGWGMLNLLPLLPLDGGHVMSAILEMIASDRGRLLARYLSLALAASLLFHFLRIGIIEGTILVGILAFMNVRLLRAEQQRRAIEPFRPDLERAYRAFAALDGRTLALAAERIVLKRPKPPLALEARLLQIWGKLLSGEILGAKLARDAHPEEVQADPALEAAFAMIEGRDEEAIASITTALEASKLGATGLRVVAAFAASGRFDLAPLAFQSRAAEKVPENLFDAVHATALVAGQIGPAAKLGELWFARFGSARAALETARAYGRRGSPDLALEWLARSRSAGLTREELAGDEDFSELASIRNEK